MRTDHGAVSLTGRRDNNEDAMLCLPRQGIFAVSDGMGGLDAGEVASQMAIESLQLAVPRIDKLREQLASAGGGGHKIALADLLDDLFQETTATIHRHGITNAQRLGATLTAGVLTGGSMLITHVGDSRFYIIREGKAAPLTEDHSVAALRLRQGKITREEYATSDKRNLLYQALGVVHEVEPDFLEIELDDGDILLFCSDGVWGSLSNRQIGNLAKFDDMQEAAQYLVDAAFRQGSDDNLTAVVYRYRKPLVARANWEWLLRGAPLFSHFTHAERLRLAPFLHEVEVAPGGVLCQEGEVGEELFVLLEGEVAITRHDVELVRLQPPQHFGEIALALRCARTATVTATQESRLLVMHRDQVDDLIRRSPRLGARFTTRLLEDLARRVVSLSERVVKQS
jgi:serine/threonine protein phosphatase PrpC